MNNKLQIFNNEQFGQVRTLVINNEPHFVGKDVAEALGYTNPQKAVRDHVDRDDRGVNEMDTPSGRQSIMVINESGLYSLIFGSKLEKAKEFKRWVTSEILPSIRKLGSYNSTGVGLLESIQTELQNTKQELSALKQMFYKDKRKQLARKQKMLKISAPLEERLSLVSDEEIMEIIKIALVNGTLKDVNEGIAIDKNIVIAEASKRNIDKYTLNKKLTCSGIVILSSTNYPYKQVRIQGKNKWCYVVKKKERLGV